MTLLANLLFTFYAFKIPTSVTNGNNMPFESSIVAVLDELYYDGFLGFYFDHTSCHIDCIQISAFLDEQLQYIFFQFSIVGKLLLAFNTLKNFSPSMYCIYMLL